MTGSRSSSVTCRLNVAYRALVMSRSTIRSSGASSPTDSSSTLPTVDGDDRAEVGDARRGERLAEADGALQGGGLEHLHVGDRHADRHARALADLRRAARQVGQLGDDLLHERRHDDVGRRASPSDSAAEALLLLADDRRLVLEGARVVGPDLRAEAVLERRDDPAARGVVLRVRRGHDVQVERQADGEAADLDVALLEHVEQADLDALGEVGQLVDRHDAPVGARDEAVVEGQLVATGSDPRRP